MIESINQSHPLPVLFPNDEDERRKNSGGTILYILYLQASKTSHLFPNEEDERRKNSGGTIVYILYLSAIKTSRIFSCFHIQHMRYAT